jgi:branched-chain amino acid transport system permease protein
MVFGSLAKLNLAHGENMMLGAFAGLVLYRVVPLPFPVLFFFVCVIGAAVGGFIYLVSFRFIDNKHELASLVSTLAVAAAMREIIVNLVGSEPKLFPDLLPGASFHVGSILVSSAQIIIAATAALVFILLYVLLTKTRTGFSIRAISESPVAASLMGVRVERTTIIIFGLGGALAAIAGLLFGNYYHAINPWMGVETGLKGIAVMILGGLGNLPGAVVAALLMGTVETLTSAYWGAGYRDAAVYAVLLLVLLVRPEGLFGARVRKERD